MPKREGRPEKQKANGGRNGLGRSRDGLKEVVKETEQMLETGAGGKEEWTRNVSLLKQQVASLQGCNGKGVSKMKLMPDCQSCFQSDRI
jgi:hypothetical protein